MEIIEVGNSADLLENPLDEAWQSVSKTRLGLTPVPVEGQPSRYVNAAYSADLFPGISAVNVSLVRAGDGELLVFMAWEDEAPDLRHSDHKFPDAAAVMFPIREDAPLEKMGSEDSPVRVWYWRPDLESECELLTAHGLGTVERCDSKALCARSKYADGHWSVVFRGPGTPLPGKAAFAIWEGGAGQRAGLKAATNEWQVLEVAR